ncbi:glycine cleavage system protein GcvH [Desulfopila inferna]|uniref:glycine cleavage system protein GcvH n=1 Tax=Desulfopila inferna TaxID=468528 RepID=UPI0019659D73|nr:glycine cleavage system protein GcvH [Desulfopila inferna]MBM9605025.1 glycine cleavage system protein GcvH [Desulfopila inferna]
MKEIRELHVPGDRSYTEDHEWAMEDGEHIKIGISDYAQDQLGDIVFVELPDVGDEFRKGDEFGGLESVKAVSELYLPISGTIVAVNEKLEDEPELLNEDPNENWIVAIEPADLSELEELMSSSTYLDMLRV